MSYRGQWAGWRKSTGPRSSNWEIAELVNSIPHRTPVVTGVLAPPGVKSKQEIDTLVQS